MFFHRHLCFCLGCLFETLGCPRLNLFLVCLVLICAPGLPGGLMPSFLFLILSSLFCRITLRNLLRLSFDARLHFVSFFLLFAARLLLSARLKLFFLFLGFLFRQVCFFYFNLVFVGIVGLFLFEASLFLALSFFLKIGPLRSSNPKARLLHFLVIFVFCLISFLKFLLLFFWYKAYLFELFLILCQLDLLIFCWVQNLRHLLHHMTQNLTH